MKPSMICFDFCLTKEALLGMGSGTLCRHNRDVCRYSHPLQPYPCFMKKKKKRPKLLSTVVQFTVA